MADSTRIGSQLKALRKARGWTQTDLAEKAGHQAHRPRRLRRRPGRATAGRPRPPGPHPRRLPGHPRPRRGHPSPWNKTCASCPIARGPEHRCERITAVSTKAAAGYAEGFGDPEWVSALPTFDLPLPGVPRDRTLRFFQIEGDSMLPDSQRVLDPVHLRRTPGRCRQWAALHRGHAGRWPALQAGREPDGCGRRPLDGLQQSRLRPYSVDPVRARSLARHRLVLHRLAGRRSGKSERTSATEIGKWSPKE